MVETDTNDMKNKVRRQKVVKISPYVGEKPNRSRTYSRFHFAKLCYMRQVSGSDTTNKTKQNKTKQKTNNKQQTHRQVSLSVDLTIDSPLTLSGKQWD
jgi:hypothetical protein